MADRIKGEDRQENEVPTRYRQEQENVRQLRGEMDSVGDRPDSAIATGKCEAYPQGERALCFICRFAPAAPPGKKRIRSSPACTGSTCGRVRTSAGIRRAF